MLLNLGSDRISVSSSIEEYILPFHHIDQELPKSLISLYKKNNPDTIYVLNGPGSFTNVRVGILAIQTLYSLSHRSFSLLSIDKLSLLYSLYKEDFIPRYGVVYFGQRKNIVILDCLEQSHDIMTYETCVSHLTLQDTEWSQDGAFFVDYLVADDFPLFVGHPKSLYIGYHQGELAARYNNNFLSIAQYFVVQDDLTPFYGIEANIS